MHDVIRKEMDYEGVLISDCIFMESLSGTLPERVKQVLDAGFDIALHSHGDIPESEAAAKAARPLTEAALQRIAAKARPASAISRSMSAPPTQTSKTCLQARWSPDRHVISHHIRKGE